MHSGPKAGQYHIAIHNISLTPMAISPCLKAGKFCEQHQYSTSAAMKILPVDILFVGHRQFVIAQLTRGRAPSDGSGMYRFNYELQIKKLVSIGCLLSTYHIQPHTVVLLPSMLPLWPLAAQL